MRDTGAHREGSVRVVRSDDMDEVHRAATSVMNAHSMTVRRRSSGAFAEIDRSAGGAVSLLRFAYRSDVEIRPAPLEDFIAVHLPVRGTLRYVCNGREHVVGPRAGVAVSPFDDVRMRWSEDLELQVVRVELSALHSRLRTLTGASATRPIVFDPVVDERRALLLTSVAQGFRLALPEAAGDAGAALLARELEHAVVSTLLLGLASGGSAPITAGSGGGSAHAAHRAADHCRAHHAEPLTVADLARVAHVSERALFAAFQQEFGTTPARWLRRLRLERAREALLTAEAANVAAVAIAHGFGHVGRFAADYRRSFGESPSDTLRRRRMAASPASS